MELSWNRKGSFLLAGERKIPCTCIVRNEFNHLRPRSTEDTDIFYTTPMSDSEKPVPSMPRIFPVGDWRITKIKAYLDNAKDGYLYPYYFGTDAWQWLDEWELDDGGRYVAPTGRRVRDTAYGFHHSTSGTTLGCIRLSAIADAMWLFANVKVGDKFRVYEE